MLDNVMIIICIIAWIGLAILYFIKPTERSLPNWNAGLIAIYIVWLNFIILSQMK